MFYFEVNVISQFWIVSKALIIWLGTVTIRTWKNIFDIAKIIKTTTLPWRVGFRNLLTFNTVFTLETNFRKLDSSFMGFLYENWVPKTSQIVS